jgi:hypothetical protein
VYLVERLDEALIPGGTIAFGKHANRVIVEIS